MTWQERLDNLYKVNNSVEVIRTFIETLLREQEGGMLRRVECIYCGKGIMGRGPTQNRLTARCFACKALYRRRRWQSRMRLTAYTRRYYLVNKEKILARSRLAYYKNKEKRKQHATYADNK